MALHLVSNAVSRAWFVAAALILASGLNLAAEPGKAGDSASAGTPPKRELIYGSELMTHQEREQYRARMRGAKTADEEARVRTDHQRALQKRARERGVKLPDPQASGSGK